MTSSKQKESKKVRSRKETKESKPLTKIIIRRLPPKLKETDFLEAVDPLPKNDYFRYVPADESTGMHSFSTAYVNFVEAEDLFHFKEKFDGYVFIDREGNESRCLVEYAPYQKVPNPLKKLKKPDAKIDTIDDDPDFVTFKEEYEKEEHPALDTPETFLEAIEKKEKEKEKETSLLQAIKEKKAEKQRLRQEKFDARKKRDEERRKAKDEEKRKRKESQKAEIQAKNQAGKKAGNQEKNSRSKKNEASPSQDDNKANSTAAAAAEGSTKRSKKADTDEKSKGGGSKKDEPKEAKPKERKYTDEEYEKIKQERREKREQRERERQEKKMVKNKERPERQIYRPGMGRFSSQSISTSKAEKSNETFEKEEKEESKESTPDPNPNPSSAGTGKKYSRGKSWRNAKQQQQQQQQQQSSSATAISKSDSEPKVYLTREFRRTSNGQVQKSEKVKNVKKEVEVKRQSPPPVQDAVDVPKKSGKSYASKRKERQQKKESKGKNTDVEKDAILDLPSE